MAVNLLGGIAYEVMQLSDASGNIMGTSANPMYVSIASEISAGFPVQGIYNTSPPALTNGQFSTLQTDVQGDVKFYLASLISGEDVTNNVLGVVQKPIIAAAYSPSLDTSFGTAVTHTSKSTPALFMGADVTNINAAVRYFQIFNSTGATTTVLFSFPIPAGTSTVPQRITIGQQFLTENGYYLSTGLAWGISTTQATYTGATASDHNVNLLYY